GQRFAWQRGLAVLRRLYLLAGRVLAERGALATTSDVFFLTDEEVRDAMSGSTAHLRDRAATRKRAYAAERERFAREGPAGYPSFLRGNQPLLDESAEQPSTLPTSHSSRHRGQAVSPGVGRGRARIVHAPED